MKSPRILILFFVVLTSCVPGAQADEYWTFINLTCNTEVAFFSLQTYGYYNPDTLLGTFGYYNSDTDSFAGREKMRTAYDLQISPFVCKFGENTEIKVLGYCDHGDENCSPGRGPTNEGFAIYVNDVVWPLNSFVSLSAQGREDWIEYRPSQSEIERTHTIEISGPHDYNKNIQARHCVMTDKTVAPRYNFAGSEYLPAEAVCKTSLIKIE